MVTPRGRTNYLNRNGLRTSQFNFDSGHSFANGFALVRKANKFGYINRFGLLATGFLFDKAEDFKRESGASWARVNILNHECWLRYETRLLLVKNNRPFSFDRFFEEF